MITTLIISLILFFVLIIGTLLVSIYISACEFSNITIGDILLVVEYKHTTDTEIITDFKEVKVVDIKNDDSLLHKYITCDNNQTYVLKHYFFGEIMLFTNYD